MYEGVLETVLVIDGVFDGVSPDGVMPGSLFTRMPTGYAFFCNTGSAALAINAIPGMAIISRRNSFLFIVYGLKSRNSAMAI